MFQGLCSDNLQNLFVGVFGLSVGFGVMSCTHTLVDVVFFAECDPFLRGEPGVSVADYVVGHCPFWIYFGYEDIS